MKKLLSAPGKPLKTVNFKNGKGSIKVKQSAEKQYRVTFAKTSSTTASISKTVKK